MGSTLLEPEEIRQQTRVVLNRVGCPKKANLIIVFSLYTAEVVVTKAIEKARTEIL